MLVPEGRLQETEPTCPIFLTQTLVPYLTHQHCEWNHSQSLLLLQKGLVAKEDWCSNSGFPLAPGVQAVAVKAL